VRDTSKVRELPASAAAVTLGGITIPVPRIWIKVAIGVAALVVLLAIAVLIAHRNAPERPAPVPAAKPRPAPPSPPATVPRDTEAQLKALLYDLQTGRTCAERKAVIPKILELRDPRAIPALKQARYNMHGGVLGVNQDNWNACLKADAEAAIKQLGGSSSQPR